MLPSKYISIFKKLKLSRHATFIIVFEKIKKYIVLITIQRIDLTQIASTHKGKFSYFAITQIISKQGNLFYFAMSVYTSIPFNLCTKNTQVYIQSNIQTNHKIQKPNISNLLIVLKA